MLETQGHMNAAWSYALSTPAHSTHPKGHETSRVCAVCAQERKGERTRAHDLCSSVSYRQAMCLLPVWTMGVKLQDCLLVPIASKSKCCENSHHAAFWEHFWMEQHRGDTWQKEYCSWCGKKGALHNRPCWQPGSHSKFLLYWDTRAYLDTPFNLLLSEKQRLVCPQIWCLILQIESFRDLQ